MAPKIQLQSLVCLCWCSFILFFFFLSFLSFYFSSLFSFFFFLLDIIFVHKDSHVKSLKMNCFFFSNKNSIANTKHIF